MLGTPTTPEQVLVTTGAQQAVNLAAQMLVRPGDEVVVETPSFSGTLDLVRSGAPASPGAGRRRRRRRRESPGRSPTAGRR